MVTFAAKAPYTAQPSSECARTRVVGSRKPSLKMQWYATGSGRANRRVGVAEALREVRGEELCELARLQVVSLRVAPGRPRIEQVVIDPRHLERDGEVIELVAPELGVVEAAAESRAEHRPRRL